jgi:hypothetical protein
MSAGVVFNPGDRNEFVRKEFPNFTILRSELTFRLRI